MRSHSRLLLCLLAVLFLLPPLLHAQPAVDPSGHWEGVIQVPNKDVKVEIDLAKNTKGALAGTFANADEGLKGIPLSTIAVEGRTVTFELKAGSGGGTFRGQIPADGQSMSGDFVTAEGNHSLPFSLTRTGEARIAPAPKSAPIGKELEGTWNGALTLGEKQMRLVLKMANQPDGTAAGTIRSLDGSNVEIPVGMQQKASSVTVDVVSVGASFVATLNDKGTELAGTWTQGKTVLPLTFRREAK